MQNTIYYTVIFDNGSEEISQEIKYGEQTALRLNTFTKRVGIAAACISAVTKRESAFSTGVKFRAGKKSISSRI